MSAHSFPSLTSDSSSIPSRSSDLLDAHSNDPAQTAVSSISRSSHALSLKDPANSSEILQLRNKVSKLEQDKFVLGDYAAEACRALLQSRIRHLERERMEHRHTINDNTDLDSKLEKAQSRLSSIDRPSLSRPTSPTDKSRGAGPLSVRHHRASSSLSVATSTTARRALLHAPSHPQTPSPTPGQLAFPSASKLRLVPKRSTRPVPPEAFCPIPEQSSSVPAPKSQRDTTTPTRRRLQAMYGRLSLDAVSQSPSANGSGSSNHDINEQEPRPLRDAHATRFHNTIPSISENDRHDRGPEPKRTTFTSKLDSIILTSKLFPLSSSRSKVPLEPTSTDRRAQNGHTTVIPLAHSLPSSSSRPDNVFLNSPPRQQVKVKVHRQGNMTLSHSLGLEENRHPEVQHRSDERKFSSRSRNRVSFSDRLFSSSSDREEETDTDAEPLGKIWGSWGRKKRLPPVLSYSKDKRTGTPPSTPPSTFSSRFAKSRSEGGGEPEENRSARRRSLAAGCLRFVSGSGERDKPHPSERREAQVLRRSHSESRKSRSHSHSRSHSPPRDLVRPDYGSIHARNPVTRDKDERPRITASRVGSPMPKGRLQDLQHDGEELERTSSLRSPGRWGQRGRGFTHDLTRRRTIHPMFSFERPGSAGASTSSSRRADDEETVDGHRPLRVGVLGETPDYTRVGKLPNRTRREVRAFESGVSSSHNHAPPTQDDSVTSSHTAPTLARSESVSTHKGKGPMMRTRLGVQTHGTFAFEPAAAVVVPPRSAPHNGSFSQSVKPANGIRRHTTDRHVKTRNEPVEGKGEFSVQDTHDRVYLDFCEDLKVVLGNGEEWASFTKYIRRFDIEVLTAEVLLRRVKKLIEGSRSVDQSTKLKLYDRFVSIVQNNLEEHVVLGS